MSDQPALPTLDDARQVLAAADSLLAGALARARVLTQNGRAIDEHQVLAERVAYAATEARAARELIEYAAGVRSEGRGDAWLEATAAAGAAELVASLVARLTPAVDDLGIGDEALQASLPRRPPQEAARRVERSRVPRDRARGCGTPRSQRDAARRDARAGALLGSRVRREGDRAARRAHPPHRRPDPGGVHHEDGRTRLLRTLGARSVRRLRDGQPRDDPHHRGALARVARRGGFADHAPGDPHQGADGGRHRGAEEVLAARRSPPARSWWASR